MGSLGELRELEAAIDAAEYPRALDLALGAWRARKLPELADLVDAIAACCTPPAPPHSKVRLAPWWREHARALRTHDDAVVVGALVDHADERMFAEDLRWSALQAEWRDGNAVVAAMHAGGNPWWLARDPQLPAWIERLASMLTWPDDPRVARCLTGWLASGRVLDVAPTEVTRVLAERIGALGDARAIPPLRDAIAEPRGASARVQNRQVELARIALARIGQTRSTDAPPGLLDAARTLATRCRPAIPPPTVADLDALWRRVLEAPDDDTPRIVLGDALVQAGDNRGELFLLQASPPPDDAAQRGRREHRIRHLIKDEWSRWLGDLALVLTRKGSELERGMLVAARVGQTSTPAWAWRKLTGQRELALVHTVRANHVSPLDFAHFVLALPQFPHTLEINAPEQLDEIARVRAPLPLRALRYEQTGRTTDTPRGQWPSLVATIRRVSQLAPTLETLAIGTLEDSARYQLRDLLPELATLFPALRRIEVPASHFRGLTDDPGALARVRKIPRVEIVDRR